MQQKTSQSITRVFRLKRWLNILFRSLHLVGLAGVGAGVLYEIPLIDWQNFLFIMLVSGVAMVILELSSGLKWLVQLRGLSTIIKLLLLACLPWTEYDAVILVAVIIISAFFAHAPADVRYYSIWHRRVI